MRSVSLARMNPTPVMRVGESAKAATAARVGTVSEQSRHVDLDALQRPVPVTVMPAALRSTVAPIRASTSTKATSPCSGAGPKPGTVTRPPVSAAAAQR